ISLSTWKRIGGALATSALTMSLLTPSLSYAAMTRLTVVDRQQLLLAVMQALHVAPDATGTSPYTDVPTSSPAWGSIHKAVETGVVTPISPTYFGATALVTEQWAVELAAAELRVSVAGNDAVQAFAKSARLFADYVPTALVLSTELNGFEQRLSQYATHKVSLSGSGTGTGSAAATLHLTPGQQRLFSLALQDSSLLSHEQTIGQQNLTTAFVLTPFGEKNALFRAETAKQTKRYTIAVSEREQSIGTVQRLAMTYVFPASFTRDHQALTEQIFTTGAQTYVNSGAGWTTNDQTGDSIAAAGDAILTLSNYDTMSAASVKGGTLFTGLIDLAKVPSLFASEVPLIGASLFDSEQLTALQEVARVQMSIFVSDINGKPQVTALGKLFSVDIPSSILFANLNAASQSTLLKGIAALHYEDMTSSTMSFDDIAVPIPAGLPK
ncbi:MAG: S-layer homology domain-containing protein, partial [Firmicutes bacterium]|nr:S-layer homology domain-containing protein [Bacillota bacterium]